MNRGPAVLILVMLSCAACRGFAGDGGAEEEEGTRVSARVDARGRVHLNAEEIATLGLQTVQAREGTILVAKVRFGIAAARPEDDVRVVAPVTGRLVRAAVSLGQAVSPDDVVAVLEPITDTASQASIRSRRADLQAQITGGQARVEADAIELQRVTQLVESRLATPSQRAQASAALSADQSLLEGWKRADHILAGFDGGSLDLEAPAGGVIAWIESRVGSLVRQGDTLARIVGEGPRWVDVGVPPGDPVGDAYRVRLDAREVPARLLSRGIVARHATRVDRLAVGAADAAGILPGRTLAVAVLHKASGIVVPLASTARLGANRVCFIERESGWYEPRRVQLAEDDGNSVIVSQGVASGETVVVQGAASLLGELGFAGLAAKLDVVRHPRRDATAGAR